MKDTQKPTRSFINKFIMGYLDELILIGYLICSFIFFFLFIIYRFLHNCHRRLLDHWRQPQLYSSNRSKPRPRRLEQNIIDMIPVIKLSLHRDDKVPELCAVCISEFTDGEKLRALPQCGHRFHLECIDMWFASRSTCPLCRVDVNSSSPNSDQQVQLGETKIKELFSVFAVCAVISIWHILLYYRDFCPLCQAIKDLVNVNNGMCV